MLNVRIVNLILFTYIILIDINCHLMHLRVHRSEFGMSGNVSDCSDDSFEIVSAESLDADEPTTLITSLYKPSVKFLKISMTYH